MSRSARGTADWSILVYRCGDNDLESSAVADLREMKRIGSTPPVWTRLRPGPYRCCFDLTPGSLAVQDGEVPPADVQPDKEGMMRKVTLGATALLLAATLGCGGKERKDLGNAADTAAARASEPLQETGGAVEGPRASGFEDRQDFAQSVRRQLADLDRQTEELANQAKSTGGSVSDRALANIRSARAAAERNLGRIDAATADNWEEIRRGVDQAVESLTEAVQGAYPK